jgi:hypothetical protein
LDGANSSYATPTVHLKYYTAKRLLKYNRGMKRQLSVDKLGIK